MVSFPELVLTATGAFFIWAVKGFKGKFNDEMVTIDQRHSLKGIIRLCLGITIWGASLLMVGKILSKPEQQPLYFEGTTNEKGELIVKPLKSKP
jgi:hypothetical protein